MAGFGWIDFSDEHRDRVFSVIDLLSDSGTVDELGVGIVRDAIADWLFPGVSTIQTRAKYFLIIPQIFLSYIKKRKDKLLPLHEYLRSEENRIIQQLADNYKGEDKKGEGNGIFGINAARNNKELERKPSVVYWSGIRTHKLISTHHSLSEYLRINDLSKIKSNSYNGGEEKDDDMAVGNDYFGIKVSLYAEVNENTRMELSKDEADFLRDCFVTTTNTNKHEGNLLTQLLKSEELIELMLKANSFQDLAVALIKVNSLPVETQKMLNLGLFFDLLMHGAHIRYNILLHKKAGNDGDEFKQEWEEWLENRNTHIEELEALDFDFIFSELTEKVGVCTQSFMRQWKEQSLINNPNTDELDSLVKKQEINKKKGKAKLSMVGGEYTGWIGLKRLNYRFPQAKTIIQDIYNANAKS